MAPAVKRSVKKAKTQNDEEVKEKRATSKTRRRKSQTNDSGIQTSSDTPESSNKKTKRAPVRGTKRKLDENDHLKRKTPKREAGPSKPDLNETDVNKLLAFGEKMQMLENENAESDSDDSDWEEVENKPQEPEIPKSGVSITLEVPAMRQKRAKQAVDLDAEVRKQLRKVQKEIQLLKHKVHVMGWLAHLRFVNATINNQLLMALMLSWVPHKKLYPPKRADIKYLEIILNWFNKNVKITEREINEELLLDRLKQQIVDENVASVRDFVLLFAVLLRTYGLKVRIVMNLITTPLRPENTTSKKSNEEKKNNKKEEKVEKKKKEDPESDEEFSKHFKPVKKKTTKKIDRRVLSSSDEETAIDLANKKFRNANDIWVEVFLEAEEKWICADVARQKVHCVKEIYTKCTHPVAYILAINNDGTIKDVTKRYVPNWHSDTRKRRIDNVESSWWNSTIAPYKTLATVQDALEDEDISSQLQDMPLPTSISEYKNHPLYALKRHLLKFEGIYPPEPATLGFIRGEPVYSRSCVVTLRSRDIWFKEARIVKQGETPYKIVKSRPKYDRMTGDLKKDLPLELFGVWQTDDYIPPTAVNGVVPRNEYGNVDLFKPCMLPFGTVHLQIPGLNRIARKLNIDCAPAIVGFEFHSGGSHPVQDGFVVCEEMKEKIVEAWSKEIDEAAKRNEEKRMKRILKNWKRLIRGLFIREKLKLKYAFGENSDEDEDNENGKASTSSS